MLLTPDELRRFLVWPTGDDADSALRQLLDATEADIAQVAGGQVAAITETLPGGYSTLVVSRPIASVSAITDDFYGSALALTNDDYRFTPGGFVLTRMWDGAYPGGAWAPWVRVVYAAPDDYAMRVTAQIGLCRLLLAYHPGLLSMTIGDWTEQYQATSTEYGYSAARAELLSMLRPGPSMVVI